VEGKLNFAAKGRDECWRGQNLRPKQERSLTCCFLLAPGSEWGVQNKNINFISVFLALIPIKSESKVYWVYTTRSAVAHGRKSYEARRPTDFSHKYIASQMMCAPYERGIYTREGDGSSVRRLSKLLPADKK